MLGLLLIAVKGQSQTAAVSSIRTYNLVASNKAATEMARIELIKIGQYKVLDYFDMMEIDNPAQYDSCYGQSCLVKYGEALNVDYLISGNIDRLGNKIIINLKLIDINKGEIAKTRSKEFDNQEDELQRMLGIVIQELHGIAPDPELSKRLAFKNEVITSNDLGKVKNSGPRMGFAYAVGSLNEFLVRPENQGGMDMAPFVTTLGYQVEKQYVGTENFSALGECLINITGLEQGKFIPSISLLNGFRWGRANWEVAFGPTFGFSRKSYGFFDTENHFGTKDKYYSVSDFNATPFSENSIESYGYRPTLNLDSRGNTYFSTRWVMAFGRTFQSGALNVPVNLYYSSTREGGMIGFSMGFNIAKEKKQLNR